MYDNYAPTSLVTRQQGNFLAAMKTTIDDVSYKIVTNQQGNFLCRQENHDRCDVS